MKDNENSLLLFKSVCIRSDEVILQGFQKTVLHAILINQLNANEIGTKTDSVMFYILHDFYICNINLKPLFNLQITSHN